MEVLLDTNFIIACVKRNIDFLAQLEEAGYKPVLAHEVLEELKDLRNNVKRDDKVAIDLALALFARRKVHKMKLGHHVVDEGLQKYGKEGMILATLDGALKRTVSQTIGISDARNALDLP